LAGLEIGKVKELRFTQREDGRNIEVVLSLPRSRQAQITVSSTASIRTVGILGDRFIDISMGSPGETPLHDKDEITVLEPTDWPATFQKAAGALDDFLELMGNASEAIHKLNEGEGTLGMLLNDAQTAQDLRRSAGDLAEVSSRLKRGEGSLGRLIKDGAMARQLEGAVARFDSLVGLATAGDGMLARLLSDPELGEQLASAVANADSAMVKLNGDGTAGELLRDPALYQEMLGTMETVHALVEMIQKNPERYLSISLF
jgi:phospholipid/cholesterol/gamma-HCH transport system substrate-binding protein